MAEGTGPLAWLRARVNQLSKGAVPAGPAAGAGGAALRVLLVQAHPLRDSFSHALADAAQAGLEDAGHSVDRVALYGDAGGAGAFQPCLTAEERAAYPSGDVAPSADTSELVDKLRRADALVFVYPTWWFNVPAILKGFVDRTFLPGTAFRLPEPAEDGSATATGLIPGLTNIRKIGCVSTYGAPRRLVFLAGDNGRNMITRGLLPLFDPLCTVMWLGLYEMDTQPAAARQAFADKVRASFRDF